MAAAEESALAANEAFYAAFAAKDAAAMDAIWSRTHEPACVHPGWIALHGRADVLESWRAILGNPEQPRIVGGGAMVALYGECAVISCRELVAGNPLAATNIFVREEGEWRLVHHHASAVMMGS